MIKLRTITARGLLLRMKSFTFIFYCNSLLLLFGRIHSLSCLLQSKDLCIKTAFDLANTTLESLNLLKTYKKEFDIIYESTVQLCKSEEITRQLFVVKEDENSKNFQKIFKNISKLYINRFNKDSLEPLIDLAYCI